MWEYSLAWIRGVNRPAFIFLLFVSLSMILLSAGAFYILERAVNPNLQSLLDALYFSVTTMTGVGFGDIVPVTSGGKLLAIIMMLGGTAIFVSFTAVLATVLMEIESSGRPGNKSPRHKLQE